MNFFKRDLDRKAINEIVVPELGYLERHEETPTTPDLLELEQKEYHNLFVCDDLMQFRRNAELLEGAIRHPFHVFTKGKFCMFQKVEDEGHSFIPLRHRFYETPFVHIRGEMYAVPKMTLIKLDFYKRNTLEFNRIRVDLILPNRGLLLPVQAFFYLGDINYWKPLIAKATTPGDPDAIRKRYVARRNPEGIFELELKEPPQFIPPSIRPVKTFKAKNPALEHYYYYSKYYEFRDSGEACIL